MDDKLDMMELGYLMADINKWFYASIEEGIPDFWNECSTTERLAEWLVKRGWRLDSSKKIE